MSPLEVSRASPAKIDNERYAIRFVLRRPRSNWSAIARDRVRRPRKEGRLTAAGEAGLPADL